jgi:hypothetical protein
MLKQSIIVLVSIFCFACTRSPENPNRPKPVKLDFYIRFKVSGQAYEYKIDEGYGYNQWTNMVNNNNGTYMLYPSIRLYPNTPINMNVYSLGFNFPGYQVSSSIDWIKSGDNIFRAGAMSYCFIGNTILYEYPFDAHCTGGDGISFYWDPPGEKKKYSARDRQPSSSYFNIDSVENYHYDNVDNNNYDFDKIIKGRFKCRVFEVDDPTKYYDIEEGEFKFGIWKNGPQ